MLIAIVLEDCFFHLNPFILEDCFFRLTAALQADV